jgi:hypothetical protein
MRRKLFTLAAVASAALCVGVCVLWVRSHHVYVIPLCTWQFKGVTRVLFHRGAAPL